MSVGVWLVVAVGVPLLASCDDPPAAKADGSAVNAGPAPESTDRSEARRIDIAVEEVFSLDPRAVRPNGGYAYHVELPPGWVALASTSDAPDRSPLILRENGADLGPPNTSHQRIRDLGGGAHSHWEGGLYFSASDGTDPRTNDRVYVVELPAEDLLGIGIHDVRYDYVVTGLTDEYTVTIPTEARVENIEIELVNVGQVDVVSPWLVANGEADWFDVEAILAEVAEAAGGSSDQELAEALWAFLSDHHQHAHPGTFGGDPHDPVRFLNVYGYGFCDDAAYLYARLARWFGIPSRTWRLEGHIVPEVYFDGDWHVYDVDTESFYVGREDDVASVAEIIADPTLLARPRHVPGRKPSAYACSVGPDVLEPIYTTIADNVLVPVPSGVAKRMDFRLRPGERIVRRWVGQGAVVREDGDQPGDFGKGQWTYGEDVRSLPAVLSFELPYPIVGGRVSVSGPKGSPERDWLLEAWTRERGWDGLEQAACRDGQSIHTLDDLIGPEVAPTYDLVVRLVPLSTEAASLIHRLDVELDFQVAPGSLPAVGPGENVLAYRSSSPSGKVAVSHTVRTVR